jgi:threonine dehydratase
VTDIPDSLASESTSPPSIEAAGRVPEVPVARENAPERPAAAIRADIARERAALQGSFATLRADLDETLDVVEQRVREARRKAVAAAPFVAGAAAAVGGALLLLRRRRRGR